VEKPEIFVFYILYQV